MSDNIMTTAEKVILVANKIIMAEWDSGMSATKIAKKYNITYNDVMEIILECIDNEK